MSTTRALPARGPIVIITMVACLVVTLVLMLFVSPCCTDGGSGVAPAHATTTVADGPHPGSVASDHLPGRGPVVDAVRLGAWTPVGLAAIVALLAGAVADRRPARRSGPRPVARYALCVMRT